MKIIKVHLLNIGSLRYIQWVTKIRDGDYRYHRVDGPALEKPDGDKLYFNTEE